MIIVGERINSSRPKIAQALARRDALFIQEEGFPPFGKGRRDRGRKSFKRGSFIFIMILYRGERSLGRRLSSDFS